MICDPRDVHQALSYAISLLMNNRMIAHKSLPRSIRYFDRRLQPRAIPISIRYE